MMGTDRHVEKREPPSRNDVDNVVGHSGGPTPGLEVEGTDGRGDCSVGTGPCVMEEQLGWGWQKGSLRGARWCREPDRGSNH